MNLPNYFFADLPAGAEFSPTMIREACQTLKRNRAQYLAGRSTQSLIKFLSSLGENWLRPNFIFRKLALAEGPAQTGFSRATIERGLDDFFKQLTPENFEALLAQDLGGARRLDEFCLSPGAANSNRLALAVAPEFLVHICAGNLPNPTWMSLLLGVLLRSAQFVKCASGSAFLPRLLAHSIYDADPKLGSCLEIAEWRGGNAAVEETLFAEADCVTATGSDETLAAIQKKLPARARFLGYGHKLSFGYVAADVLGDRDSKKIISAAAEDVTAWNQLGCLSPHVLYVQSGGVVMPQRFAELLAEELEQRETTELRGDLPAETAAHIASRRAIYEVRAAHSPETQIWSSKNSTAWTVVFEEDPRFAVSCLHRFVYVKPVANLSVALQAADPLREKVSSVGLAASEDNAGELAAQLARWGVKRICPPGRMQNPPLTWRHDGRPALGDLVTWTDWER